MQSEKARFTKLDSSGSELPLDAAAWSAVRDNATNLVWSKDAVSKSELTFAKAEDAVTKLVLCNATDWRLPTIEELFALADRTRFNPAIDTNFFPGTKSDWYWTSSPGASSPESYAWIVYFDYGYAGVYHRGYEAFVRAVRSARASQ